MDILQYFGLNEPPFRISPDPRFLYLSDQVKEALAKVQYMTKERIGPLYMYGPIGSGKTSIMRRLSEQLQQEDNSRVELLFVPNIKTANAFLRLILDAYGVKTDRSYAQSLKHFEAFLLDQYKQGVAPVLLIDEGQNMTRDTLKLIHYLLNFETDTEKLLQIVIAGQEELGQRILRYQELASRMFPIAMISMSATDLQDMLEFRYMVAGGKQSPFTDGAYKEIHACSKGLPRDAVKLADEALRHLFLRQRRQTSVEDIRTIAQQLNLKM
jgi:general secretion pathway protein A